MNKNNPQMSNLDCSVVIPSFNSKDITDTCLAKLKKSIDYCRKTLENNIAVLVVENGSSDGSREMIREKYPWVKLIPLKENIGTARANNLAMEQIKTPYILLINSDLYVEEDTLFKSLSYMQKKSSCDILCCRYVNLKNELKPYGGHLPTPFKTIRWLLGIESMPVIKHLIKRIYGYNLDFYSKEGKMEWCPACFLMLRKKVYTKTKGFSDKTFFYMDDVEWFKRVQREGFNLMFTPKIRVTHLGGESSKKLLSKDLLRWQIEGIRYFHSINYPKTAWLVIWFLATGIKIRAIFYFLVGQRDKANLYKNAVVA